MKIKTVVTAVVVCLTSMTFGQGSLTPPGTPAPTMKTLDQVEPRTAITNLPYTISQPGSYYLTGNLTGELTISADDVTLNLMGFSIIGTSWNAITQTGYLSNVRIHNGVISAPNGNGIEFSVSQPNANGVIEDLRVYGCKYSGIAVGSGFKVRNCMVSGVGSLGTGIDVYGNSEVTDCKLTGNAVGVKLSDTGAYIANNIVKGNTDNYDLAAGNRLNILLCEVPETLDWPCSVKFVGTLVCTSNGVNGISVNSDDVSIDLDGHTLVGPGASSGCGIYQSYDYCNLSIKNGKVVEWRGTNKKGIDILGTSSLLYGIQAATNYNGISANTGCKISACTACQNVDTGLRLDDCNTVSDCTAYQNGEAGIYVKNGNTIRGCAVYENGGYGLLAIKNNTISDCTAYENKSHGISANVGSTICNCSVENNLSIGIHGERCTISACTVMSNSNGIFAANSCIVSDCLVVDNIGDGIKILQNNLVADNLCNGHRFGAGIYAEMGNNRINGNNVTDNDRGIDVNQSGNFIVRNTASGNTTNYVITGTQTIGPIITTTGTITNTNPWANFEF